MFDFFGQPPGGPFQDPWEVDPLADPLDHALEDPLQAMQNTLDNPAGFPPGYGGGVCPPNPDFFMDGLGRTLTELEESIEGTEIPPPEVEEPLLSPEPPAPITEGYTSEGALPPPEGTEHSWNTLQPPPAARPYYTPHGIMSPLSPSHHRPGHAGAGIRNANASDDQPEERYCGWAQDWVSLETCTENCEYYDEDAGLCRYDYDNEEES